MLEPTLVTTRTEICSGQPGVNQISQLVSGLVSVVMPAYNCEQFIAESIASVVAQTYRDWELLIIDDGSADRTLSAAEKVAYTDDRIRVIPLSKNSGVANARNVGIGAARGQYIAFLDADDLWLPDKLQSQIQFMRQNEIGFCFCGYRRFRIDAKPGPLVRVPRSVGYRELLRGNVIGCLTVLIDRTKVSLFLMSPFRHEDYYAWLQILKCGQRAWGLQQDLARYRISSGSVSGAKHYSALWTWKIYRKLEKLSVIQSLWYFTNYSVRAVLSRAADRIAHLLLPSSR